MKINEEGQRSAEKRTIWEASLLSGQKKKIMFHIWKKKKIQILKKYFSLTIICIFLPAWETL